MHTLTRISNTESCQSSCVHALALMLEAAAGGGGGGHNWHAVHINHYGISKTNCTLLHIIIAIFMLVTPIIDYIDYVTEIGNLHMRNTGTPCYGYRPSNG